MIDHPIQLTIMLLLLIIGSILLFILLSDPRR